VTGVSIVPYPSYPGGQPPVTHLQMAVAHWVAQGWRVESQSPGQAVLVDRSCNHVLHGVLFGVNFVLGGTLAGCLFFTVVVPLLWFVLVVVQAIVWISLSSRTPTRRVFTLDSGGTLHVT
jgi:hypothetical protein